MAANQYVLTGDARLTNARPPTPGSASYIQNGNVQQPSSTFNISGNGVVNGNLGIGIAAPTAKLHVVGGGVFVDGGTVGIAVDAETGSGGEALYAECKVANNNCYSVEGYAPAGDYAGYLFGGKGVYVESDDSGRPGVDAKAFGTGSYAVSGVSGAYRAGYFKSSSNVLYSLYVDDVDGPTQATAALNVHGTIRGEGNLVIAGSKAGFVVDIMQNADTTALEPGDVVVIEGSTTPVIGSIPVVTVKKATAAYDTGVAGVVDEIWYAPDTATKAAYEKQENAMRAAMQQRSESQADLSERQSKAGSDQNARTSTKTAAPEIPLPEIKITDERGTVHALAGVTSAGPGGYLSVVTLGSYKVIKVDASFGAIRPGDLLTTSSHAGYAMKVSDRTAAIGAIIGKALGSLNNGTGVIPVLIMPK